MKKLSNVLNPPAILPRLVPKPDIAQRYKVSTRTIDSWMTQGLPYRKISSKTVPFDPGETDAWVDTFKVEEID
jgi:hypothetical protein